MAVAVRQEHHVAWTQRNPLGALKEEASARDTEVQCHLRARREPEPPRGPRHRAAVDLTCQPRAIEDLTEHVGRSRIVHPLPYAPAAPLARPLSVLDKALSRPRMAVGPRRRHVLSHQPGPFLGP